MDTNETSDWARRGMPQSGRTTNTCTSPDGLSKSRTPEEPYADASSPDGTGRGLRVVRARWRVLLIVSLLATAAALLIDQGVTDRLTDDAVRGRIVRWLGPPAAAGAYFIFLAILASFPNRRRLCVGFLAAVLLSTLITHALKWSIGRARPRLELGPLAFQPWSGVDYFDSFPSGHSAAAATLAVLLGIYFPKARWVFYVFAGLWGLERIMDNWHFLSDVLAGYVVGACAVWACIGILGSTYYDKDRPATTVKNT